ncbi:MAG TPA: TPM domain-containing protein, partial [Pseudolabrys sp.]
DRNVEIVADRGIDAKVGAAGWEKICVDMETDFKAGNFEGGVVKGIEAVSRQLAKYYPPHTGNRNELPDAPVVM